MNVIITGATGGIGKAVSEYLGEKGIHVFACDKNQTEFKNSNIEFISLDVTDKNSITSLYNKLSKENVTVDAIISIAGIFMIDSFNEGNSDEIQKIFDVNLLGVINVNKILFPLVKKEIFCVVIRCFQQFCIKFFQPHLLCQCRLTGEKVRA